MNSFPKFEAVTPDPIYAVGKGGRDNHVSKQARVLQAAGYDKAQIGAFLMTTDVLQYTARLEEANSMRLYIHMAASDISVIRGVSFDPEHVFALALKSKMSATQVREEIITIRAEHDEATRVDTTPYAGNRAADVYTARALQVANHGR